MKNVITLIGSTRHKEAIQEIAKILSKGGFSVFCSHVFSHSGDIVSEKELKNLHDVMFRNITISDVVIVVNHKYIGDSTLEEMRISKELGKSLIGVYDFSHLKKISFYRISKEHMEDIKRINKLLYSKQLKIKES